MERERLAITGLVRRGGQPLLARPSETAERVVEPSALALRVRILTLNPSCCSDLMLNPCVGMMCEISSSLNFFRAEVLPGHRERQQKRKNKAVS